jgi:hypothetical protein
VVVAVVAMRVVQVAVDQIVDVIAVRHRLMSATGPMLVSRLMAFAAVLGRAAVGIGCRHFDHVLVDMVCVWVMQMPIVQVIDMITVAHGGMAAVLAVRMCVIGVVRFLARRHGRPPNANALS